MFCVIVPCLCNEFAGMSGVIYAIVPCLCNEVSGMSGVFCAVTCLCNDV